MWDEQARIIGSVVIFTNITERTLADEALQREREFLDALLESLSDGIAACDEAGALRLFNRSTRRLTALPEDDVTPEQWAAHLRSLPK